MMDPYIIVKDFASPLVAAIAASFAIGTYKKNGATRRAEFLIDLHKSFFVEEGYKPVRDILDPGKEGKAEQLVDLIAGEGEDDLVVFLNFFELVAYLQTCGNISRNDVEAILGYYLRLMRDESVIRTYIADNTKSFEHLDRLLDRLE